MKRKTFGIGTVVFCNQLELDVNLSSAETFPEFPDILFSWIVTVKFRTAHVIMQREVGHNFLPFDRCHAIPRQERIILFPRYHHKTLAYYRLPEFRKENLNLGLMDHSLSQSLS